MRMHSQSRGRMSPHNLAGRCPPGRAVLAGIFALLVGCLFEHAMLAQTVTWPGTAARNPMPQGMQPGQDQLPLATLSGTVINPDPRSIASTCLEVHDMSNTQSVSLCTGADGSFEIRDIPIGEYEVVVSSGQEETRQMVRVSSHFTMVSIERPGAGYPVGVPSKAGGASVTVSQLAIPNKAKHALEKAQHAVRKNQFSEARKYIGDALTLFPRYADALMLSAILDLHDNKPSESASEAAQAVACDQTNGMAYVILAASYNALSHFPDALRAVESGIRFRPDAWQAYFEKARAELGTRQFGPALADASRAEELNRGQTPLVHLLEGDALVNLARYPEAVTKLNLFLKQTHDGPTADYARKLLSEAETASQSKP